MIAYPGFSAPVGGVVSAGDVAITQSGGVATITQGSDRAVIDWRSFDVNRGETVAFQQPSAQAITLNRIHDGKPSEISGNITANGQVVLINPNGVVFMQGSKVDVAGLVASTADTTNDAFMAGGTLTLTIPGKSDATITNAGDITVGQAGIATLVAPKVRNDGAITARMGTVQLAGAETATIDMYGDGLLSFAVTDKATSVAVTNHGRIEAANVMLTAAQASSLVSSTVNMDGVIEASHMRVDDNGTVVLGGEVNMTAQDVAIGNGANIRADGRDGGGSIKMGGGWQGKNIDLPANQLENAQNTIIAKDTFISANATHHGNGGTVVAWADGTTQFDGAIEAKGGSLSGNGGKIETSGREYLSILHGRANASSPHGLAGDWLLDPTNITITQSGGTSVTSGGCGAAPTYSCSDLSVSADSISSGLSAGNNVIIAATGDITFSGAAISSSSASDVTLTMKADGSILTAAATTNSITGGSSGGGGKLHTIFWSDADNSGAGNITLDTMTSITTNHGDFIAAGGLDNGADILDINNVVIHDGTAADGRPDNFARGSAGTNAVDNGVHLSGLTLNTGDGSIIMRGRGTNELDDANIGVYISGATRVESTGGKIVLHGIGGDGTNNNIGVQVVDANTIITSERGNIYAIGETGNANGTSNSGILISSGGKISSTGLGATAGNITLHGTMVNGSANNSGVMMTDTDSSVTTKDGDITIIGKGGTGTGSVYGVRIIFAAKVTSDGVGGSAGNIHIEGTGGNAASGNNSGVFLAETNTGVFTKDGDITIIGTGGSGNSTMNGVRMARGAKVVSDSVGSSAGFIKITGTGGSAANGNNHGIFFSETDTGVYTKDGNVELRGTGGPTGNVNNNGIRIYDGSKVVSNGSGGLLIRGTGTGTTNSNEGVIIYQNAKIESTGTGTVGDVEINGDLNAPLSTSTNTGVRIFDNTTINSKDAAVKIIGSSAGNTGTANYGVLLEENITLNLTGKGNLSITGTGANSSADIAMTNSVGNSITITGNNSAASQDVNFTLVADKLNMHSTVSLATDGSITVKPRTSGSSIGVSGGTCGGTCGLDIVDSTLNILKPDNDGDGVGSLIIGDKDNGTGLIDINGWDFSGKTYDVEFYGGTVDLTSGLTWNGGNDVTLYSRTGNLNIDYDLMRNSGVAGDGTLTLKASGDINVFAGRTVTGATTGATGKLNMTLWSDADDNGNGRIIYTPNSTTTNTNGGNIIMGGGLDPATNPAVGVDQHGVTINGNIYTGAGNITINGKTTGTTDQKHGVVLNRGTTPSVLFETSSGIISINGSSTVTAAGSYGIFIGGTAFPTVLRSNSGAINVTGSGSTTATVGHGVRLKDDAQVLSTSGIITIDGTGYGTGGGFSTDGTPTVGGASHTSQVKIIADSHSIASTPTLQTLGTLWLVPKTPGSAINVAGGVGGLRVTSTFLGFINAKNIIIGDSTSGLVTVNPYASWATQASSGVEFLSGSGGITFAAGAHQFGTRALTATTAGPLAVNGAITAGTTLLKTTGATSDITLGGASSITSSATGDAIVLASGQNFINNSGASVFSTPSGRWLVYSGDPDLDTIGGVPFAFQQFDCTYGGACGIVPGGGKGLLYRKITTGGGGGGGGSGTGTGTGTGTGIDSGNNNGGGTLPDGPTSPATPPSTPPTTNPSGPKPPFISGDPSSPVISNNALPDFQKQGLVQASVFSQGPGDFIASSSPLGNIESPHVTSLTEGTSVSEGSLPPIQLLSLSSEMKILLGCAGGDESASGCAALSF